MNDHTPVRSGQSPPTQNAAHAYAPSWWYPTAIAVFTFALFAIARAVYDAGTITMLVVPVTTAVVIRRGARIELSAEGVTLNGRTVSWESFQLTKGRFGESLIAESKESGRRRANILLPVYERRWRTGRIGEDLRRWAPGLVPDSNAVL